MLLQHIYTARLKNMQLDLGSVPKLASSNTLKKQKSPTACCYNGVWGI